MNVLKYSTPSGNIKWMVEFVYEGVRHRKRGFEKKSEALRWKDMERARLRTGGLKVDQITTLGEYLDWWHGSFTVTNPGDGEVYKRPGRMYRYANHKRNLQHIQRIKPVIGNVRLSKLTADHAHMLEKVLRKTDSNPNGVAVSTIRKMQFMLKGALSDGVKQKKLDTNPLADAIVAETDDVDYAPHSFSISDAQTVLETIYTLEDRRWTMFFVLGLRTGLRKGEIAALQWSDFTFGENISFLEVKRAVDWSKGDNKPFLKSPKTKKSKRQIVLTNDTAHELKLYRAWQSQKWMECGQELTEDALLFFNDNFGLVSKSVPQHRWDKVIKKSGVQKLTLHKLRHTFATYLWKQSKDLSLVGKMLGHSNEKTTQIYVDKIDEMEKEAKQLQQVENLFKRGTPRGTQAQQS